MENNTIILEIKNIDKVDDWLYKISAVIDNKFITFSFRVSTDAVKETGIKFLEIVPGYDKLVDEAMDAVVMFQKDFWRFVSLEVVKFPLEYETKRRRFV